MVTVLVVDDNEQNRVLLNAQLTARGYKVTLAANGGEALERLREERPDLVISDILMPGMDGYSLCHSLRSDEHLKDLPLVFYTATYTDQKDEQFALSLGADRFILKPQEPAVLVGIITEVLDEHQKKAAPAVQVPDTDQVTYYEQYNEALVRRLEAKLADLELARASLEREAAERRLAEQAAQQNERQYRELVQNAGTAIIRWRRDGMISFINEYAQVFFGYTAAEIVGKSIDVLVPGITAEGWTELVDDIVRHPERHANIEVENVCRDGRRVWMVWANRTLMDVDGEVTELLGVALDVTDRRRAEAALRESERRLSEAQRMVQMGNWVWDVATGDVHWSDEVYRIFQLDPKEFVPRIDSILALSPWPEDHERDKELIRKAMESREKGEYEQRFLRPDNTVGYYVSTFQGEYDPTGALVRIIGTVQDITERKRAEHALLASETRYRRLFESSKDGILVLDGDTGEVVDVNPFLCELLGYECEYFVGKRFWETGLFRDVVASESAFRELQETGYVRREGLSVVTREGRLLDVEFVGNAYLGDAHRVAQCIVRDITERLRAEEALALHARQVQALLDLQLLSHAPEEQVQEFALEACVGATQSDLGFVCIMDESESLVSGVRWSSEAAVRCTTGQPKQSLVCSAGSWAECIRRHEPVLRNEGMEERKGAPVPEGHVVVRRFLAVPALDEGRVVAMVAVANKGHDYNENDVSAVSTLLNKMWEILSRQRQERERLLLEEQYRQAQKMEAIGRLAGGVAHDFNNILQAIVGYSSMLMDQLPEDDEGYGYADEIARGAERASGLTRQLLAFSRRQVLAMEDLDLNEVVRDVTRMIRRLIGEDIEVRIAEGRHLDGIHADRGQMEQVVLNLCINARDAMEGGGVLGIETENVAMDQEYCDAHPWASPGRYVLLSVTDTGCGMDEATQIRIFEPFFTTKETGKGTGLGLATVYGIVRQHQGMIQVYSEVGQGTRFAVYLPSLDRKTVREGVSVTGPALGGTETILVAEDNETLRLLATRVLQKAGYTVLAAADGFEAIEIFEKHADAVRLVLTDVVMPKAGGEAVYAALSQRNPDLRFLFSSGYTTTAVSTAFLLQEGMELLQKPYAPDVLLRKVRQVLDQPRQRRG